MLRAGTGVIVAAVKGDGAGIGDFLEEGAEQGRFAGPVGADQGSDLAARQLGGQAAQDIVAAQMNVQIFYGNQRMTHGSALTIASMFSRIFVR